MNDEGREGGVRKEKQNKMLVLNESRKAFVVLVIWRANFNQ